VLRVRQPGCRDRCAVGEAGAQATPAAAAWLDSPSSRHGQPARRTFVFGACGLALALARAQTPAPPAPLAPSAPVPSFSEAARQRLWGGSADEAERFEQQRLALLALAQRHLEAGEADSAMEALERAALMRHAADTELAQVRALMAQGHYQRALAACAHTAGAHRDERAGAALYTWLLHLGGQSVVAQRLLGEALRRSPDDALLLHTRAELGSDWPLAGPPLRQGPWHAAPWPHGPGAAAAVAADARLIGTATLLGDGAQAVTRALPLPAGARLWLRNGLGQTVEVARRRAVAAPDAAADAFEVLSLSQPLPPPAWEPAAREPFAGSPAFMVEYAPDPHGRAAWPLLRQGFFAGVPGSTRSRPLGVEAPSGARGGPVFDAFGRLAGVALPAAGPAGANPALSAGDRLLGSLHLAAAVAGLVPAATPMRSAPRIGPELAYELALRGALQLLTDAPPGG
jgi:tetratricopeptide (TPR) repeat protein